MPRFLHLADIHLGYDNYGSKERTKDFFLALNDVLERYAIAANVDFVVIAGDLFEHRNIQPHILNQAQLCLQKLQEANIPVIAIEGNHDNCPYGTKTSWLRYLAEWYGLILLEPAIAADGTVVYEPWCADEQCGGYIDLDCGVRVLGSAWYGSSAPKAIAQLAAAMQALPPTTAPTVMLFHHGLEGQIARYQGALRYADLLPLKAAGVHYLALGHIHKHYTHEGWIFNPGSLEANSMEESGYQRGAYLVDISPTQIQAELKQDYYQRSMVRLRLTARGQESPQELEQGAIAEIQTAIQSGQLDPARQPIVELRIDGQIAFDRQDLDTRKLQHELQAMSQALVFRLRYDADRVEYATPTSDEASRHQIEQEIFIDLLAAHNSYKKEADRLAQVLIDLKHQQADGCPESELYEFIQSLLHPDQAQPESQL